MKRLEALRLFLLLYAGFLAYPFQMAEHIDIPGNTWCAMGVSVNKHSTTEPGEYAYE